MGLPIRVPCRAQAKRRAEKRGALVFDQNLFGEEPDPLVLTERMTIAEIELGELKVDCDQLLEELRELRSEVSLARRRRQLRQTEAA